jgi:hypothetical protein
MGARSAPANNRRSQSEEGRGADEHCPKRNGVVTSSSPWERPSNGEEAIAIPLNTEGRQGAPAAALCVTVI